MVTMYAALQSVNRLLVPGDVCILTIALDAKRYLVVLQHAQGLSALLGIEQDARYGWASRPPKHSHNTVTALVR